MNRVFYHTYRVLSRIQYLVRQRLTRSGQLVAAAIVLTAVFGLNTHLNLSHQIFGFLVALALISFFASRFFKVKLSIRRTLPRYATVAEPLLYRLWIVNQSRGTQQDLAFQERTVDPRPSWDTFRKHPEGTSTGGLLERLTGFAHWRRLTRYHYSAVVERASLPRIGQGAERDVQMRISPQHRGRLELPGLAVTRPDPLGLVRSQRVFDLYGTVLVLPRLYRLPNFVLPGTRQHQPGGVALASSVGDSEEFVGLRDYRPGDPLRRIHWKSWAKTGTPIVREYQEEFFVRHALILDTFTTSGNHGVFEDAVSLAASFVSEQSGETLLDLMFVGPEAYCFTSGRGLAQSEKMLEILAGVSPCDSQSFETLEPLILDRAGMLSAGICVLLDWNEQRHRMVGALRQLNVPLEVFIIVPEGHDRDLDPGPMQDRPHRFHVLQTGHIQEELDQL